MDVIAWLTGPGHSDPHPTIIAPGCEHRVTALAISVTDAILCLPDGTRTGIDLTAYALAEPDLIAAYTPELVAHLNAARP